MALGRKHSVYQVGVCSPCYCELQTLRNCLVGQEGALLLA